MFVKSLPQHVPSIFIFPPATLVACLFILSNTSSVHGQAAFNNLGGGGGAGGGMGMTGGGISSQQFLGNNNGVPNSNTFNDIGGDGGPLNTSSPSLGGNADGVGMVGGGLGPNGVSPLGSNGPTNTGKNSGGNIPPSPIGGGMNNNNNGPAANRGIPYQCSGTSFRKEVRDMASDGQLQSFVTAFKQLATDGTLAKFVNWHSPNKGGYWDFAHFTPRFLPWHRLFIKEFEKALVNAGAPYLPYWDWVRIKRGEFQTRKWTIRLTTSFVFL